jgi:beta-glucosidase-like glycosyl hydrolase
MEEQDARRALGRISALRLPRSWEELDLERFPVANYIVFSDVFEPTLEASRERLADARKRLKTHGIEALLMMDEEGGRVTQTSRFFASAPSPRAVARALSPEEACDLYAHLGAFLAQLGIDLDLAPCLDVATERVNPIIGTRAFGTDPDTVSRFGEAAIRGLRRSISCVGKHFPGHGMTRLDSHLALPVVDDSRETLERVHAVPFRKAIDLGVDGIMASHCVYPAIQSDGLPATLSRQIVRDHLRDDFGYEGLVLTDSLDMKAIAENFRPGEAAVKAFDASCDILLYTEIGERFEAAFASLVDLLVRGRLDRGQIARSIQRREQVLGRPERGLQAGAAYDLSEYLRLAETARAGATRLDGRPGPLPLGPETLVVGTSGRALRRIAEMGLSVEVLGAPDRGAPEVSGKQIVLWLAEPLALGVPVETLRAMAGAAKGATLVTTYDAMAEALPECGLRIITDDLSPATEDSILKRVLGIPPEK